MSDPDKLQRALEIQNKIKAIQESIIETVVSSNNEIEITVNGLMQIINVKINCISDSDHLGETFQATTNYAFELVNNKSKHAIALLAQSYGLPGL